MLAVLVAVAVLPAVTVSIYALRTASDALAQQWLTLTAEGCATDARRAESLLDSIRQDLGNVVRENGDLRSLLPELMPIDKTQPGERAPTSPLAWTGINADVNGIDQRMRSVFGQYPSCRSLWVFSLGFAPSPTAVLKLDRREDEVETTRCLHRDLNGYILPRPEKPRPEAPDPLAQAILREFA